MMKQHYATPASNSCRSRNFCKNLTSNQIAQATINLQSADRRTLTQITGNYYEADKDGKDQG